MGLTYIWVVLLVHFAIAKEQNHAPSKSYLPSGDLLMFHIAKNLKDLLLYARNILAD